MRAQQRLWFGIGAAVIVAFALRVAVMWLLRSYDFPPTQDHYLFGTEMGRVARSLVSGRGFASPLQGETGPTAMVGPVYPLVIAAVFKLWGVYTTTSAIVLLSFNAVLSALTTGVVYLIGRTAVDDRLAMSAAWVWALFPLAVYTPVLWVWDTSMSALMFALIFLATLRLARSMCAADGAWYGALWGITILTNTTYISLLPVFAVWLSNRRIRCGGRWLGPAAAALFACALVLAPWIVRNDLVFGHVLLRSNLGLELAQGNPAPPSGARAWQLHPAFNASEMARYRALGELRYMRIKQREAVDFITGHPGRFAQAASERILLFWFGARSFAHLFDPLGLLYALSSLLAFAGLAEMMLRRNPAWLPFAAVVAVFPAVYYVTHAELRFRHLIEPQLLVLAAYGGMTVWRRMKGDDRAAGHGRESGTARIFRMP
jgi:hypothetical protein